MHSPASVNLRDIYWCIVTDGECLKIIKVKRWVTSSPLEGLFWKISPIFLNLNQSITKQAFPTLILSACKNIFYKMYSTGKRPHVGSLKREKVQSGKLAGVKFKTKIQFFVNILRRIFWNILRILNKYLESKCAIREVGGIKIEEEGPSLIWRTCSQQWLHGWILRWQ